jgi:hypothetical protein
MLSGKVPVRSTGISYITAKPQNSITAKQHNRKTAKQHNRITAKPQNKSITPNKNL